MITPTCPKCNRVITGEDINVAKDIAYCRECNVSYSLTQLTHGAELASGVDLTRPPAGAWSRNDGSATVIGATHRSIGTAFGALFISLFWNGIVSVFVCLALGETLQHLHKLPRSFLNLEKGDQMPLGLVIFLWIFLIPFIFVGMMLITTLFSSLFGRTEVRIQNSEGVVLVGIGPIGWRRRFDAQAVKEVRVEDTYAGNNGRKTNIVIETREGKLIKFGSMLRDERRKFVAAATSKALR